MPEKKKGIAKLVDDYKFKRKMKKKAKAGSKESHVEKYDSKGDIIFKNGGKTKRKVKKAGKKTIRKINRGKDVQTQSAKDIMAKVVGRTQDPVKSGSAGSGSIKKTPKTKTKTAFSYAKSTAKKIGKASLGIIGYSKGGLIQHD
tara:strand:- start:35 stop:466 length:432 start_codon:yes stop_codon:yes gene_type:complete